MDIAELSRLVENVVRIGTVFAVDHAAARCRVKSGKLETQWRPWLSVRAGETRTWDPPTVGEQAILLSPSGVPEGGIVIVGLYSDAKPAPDASPDTHVIAYPDGARIEYDHASGHLQVTGIQTARVQASTFCQVDCPESEFTGNVVVKGKLTVHDLLTYKAGMSGTGGGAGTAISGNFTHVDGNLSSHGVVLHTHTHPDPQGGDVGEPV